MKVILYKMLRRLLITTRSFNQRKHFNIQKILNNKRRNDTNLILIGQASILIPLFVIMGFMIINDKLIRSSLRRDLERLMND